MTPQYQVGIEDEIVAAKMIAFERRPYFAAGLNALVPVRKPGLGTFAVDHYWRMYYDPACLTGPTKWDVREIAGVITHELGHLLREHYIRKQRFGANVDHRLWNLAGDCEINDDLIAEVFLKSDLTRGFRQGEPLTPLPGAAILPKTFGFKDGQFAETYYNLLLDEKEKHNNKLQAFLDLIESLGEKGDPSKGKCGSCCDGKAGIHDAPVPVDGDDNIPAGIAQAESEILKREVARQMEEYKSDAERKGDLPGGWDRWAKHYLKPKVNYTAWIRAACRNAYIEAADKADYTWMRPSRRRMYGPFVLPGMLSYTPQIGVGIDTSGSMDEGQLSQCLAEVAGVIQQTNSRQEIVVASCDTVAHNVQKIISVGQIKMKGGGGTDMGVALDALAAIKPKRDLLILLTDCETSWPDLPPKAVTVIIQIGGSGKPPKWCRHFIRIEVGETLTGGIAA
jgi:predicted metal-dependent peptidase